VVAAVALARKRPGEALRNQFPAARVGYPTSRITGVRNYIANQFSALAKIVSRGLPLRFWALSTVLHIVQASDWRWAVIGEKGAI
jgi:hypothetical protein